MDKCELTILHPKPLTLQHPTVWLMRARTVRAVIWHRQGARQAPLPTLYHPLHPGSALSCPRLLSGSGPWSPEDTFCVQTPFTHGELLS